VIAVLNVMMRSDRGFKCGNERAIAVFNVGIGKAITVLD
jgi:hypothetical protein